MAILASKAAVDAAFENYLNVKAQTPATIDEEGQEIEPVAVKTVREAYEQARTSFDIECDELIRKYLSEKGKLQLRPDKHISLDGNDVICHFTTTEETAEWLPVDSGNAVNNVTSLRDMLAEYEVLV